MFPKKNIRDSDYNTGEKAFLYSANHLFIKDKKDILSVPAYFFLKARAAGRTNSGSYRQHLSPGILIASV